MQNIFLLLPCLACVGHGRQVSSPVSPEPGAANPLEVFAKLILSFSPAASFNPSISKVSFQPTTSQKQLRRCPTVASTGRYLSEGSLWPGSQTTVQEHMREKLITLAPTSTIKDAALLIMENHITGAPVMGEDGKMLGVISRKDLLRIIAEGRKADGGKEAADELLSIEMSEVQEWMTTNPLTISPDATVLEAAQIMWPNQISRLMVVDAAGKLQGILTSSDVIRIALCDELTEINYDADDEGAEV